MEEIKLSITLLNYQLQPVVSAKRKQAGWGPSLTPHLRGHVHRGIPLAPPSSTPDTPIQPPSACLPATAPGLVPPPPSTPDTPIQTPLPVFLQQPLARPPAFTHIPMLFLTASPFLLDLVTSGAVGFPSDTKSKPNPCKHTAAHAPVICSLLFFCWPLSSAAHGLLVAHRNLWKVSLICTPYAIHTH